MILTYVSRIRELADKHKRYGSPGIHALLRREGIAINHKKTERITTVRNNHVSVFVD